MLIMIASKQGRFTWGVWTSHNLTTFSPHLGSTGLCMGPVGRWIGSFEGSRASRTPATGSGDPQSDAFEMSEAGRMLRAARAYPRQLRTNNQVAVPLLVPVRPGSRGRTKEVLDMSNDYLSAEPESW